MAIQSDTLIFNQLPATLVKQPLVTGTNVGFWFKRNGFSIRLPYNPESFKVVRDNDNVSENILTIGEVTGMKTPKLRVFEISSFFPGFVEDNLYTVNKQYTGPGYLINLFSGSRQNKEIWLFSVIGTNGLDRKETPVTIENFTPEAIAGSTDINFDMTLKEWKPYGATYTKLSTAYTHKVPIGQTTPPAKPKAGTGTQPGGSVNIPTGGGSIGGGGGGYSGGGKILIPSTPTTTATKKPAIVTPDFSLPVGTVVSVNNYVSGNVSIYSNKYLQPSLPGVYGRIIAKKMTEGWPYCVRVKWEAPNVSTAKALRLAPPYDQYKFINSRDVWARRVALSFPDQWASSIITKLKI